VTTPAGISPSCGREHADKRASAKTSAARQLKRVEMDIVWFPDVQRGSSKMSGLYILFIHHHDEYVAEKIHMFYGGDTVKRYLRWENGRAFAK
jgi:hypothetical protein